MLITHDLGGPHEPDRIVSIPLGGHAFQVELSASNLCGNNGRGRQILGPINKWAERG